MMKPVDRHIHEMYLQLGKKIIVNDTKRTCEPVDRKYVVAFTLNMQSLGFMPSEDLLNKLATLSYDEFVNEAEEIRAALISLNGSRTNMLPMYPDFPEVMMSLSDEQLFFDAIMHFFTMGQWEARFEDRVKMNTPSLLNLKTISLGSEEDLKSYISALSNSSVAMSDTQKENLESLICRYYNELNQNMFDMKNKENMAFTIYTLYRLQHKDLAETVAYNNVSTSTDVLRLVMAFLQDDYTLSSHSHNFTSIKRGERRFLLNLLNETCKHNKQVIEDASRYQGLWIVVGEILHPGDYRNRYDKAYNFFSSLRNEKARSWYSKVEKAYDKKDLNSLIKLLKSRPGEFARRLERTIRLAIDNGGNAIQVINEFATVAPEVDSTILLQMQQFFADKISRPTSNVRTFFPKGQLAKVFVKEDDRSQLGLFYYTMASATCMTALIEKFSNKEELGKVYIDEALKGYVIPLKQRTASKQLYSMARGSRIALPEEAKVLRMYQWWKNPGHTDLDLTAMFLDKDFCRATTDVSYFNTRNIKIQACHSGDIRSAQNGAAEFIDVPVDMLKEAGIKYVLMTISSYSAQPFCDLTECFAGIMVLDEVKPKERTFDPAKSVVRSDIASDSRTCTPLLYDVETHELVWLDMPVIGSPLSSGPINTITHGNSFINTLRGMVNASYPQLMTLIQLHCTARNAEIVDTPEEADVIFSLTEGITPFSIEEINSNWL